MNTREVIKNLKQKVCTTIKQSKRLLKLGLDDGTADMWIGNYVGASGKVDGTNVHYYLRSESFCAPEIIPAWSLSALWDLLPHDNICSVELNNYEGEKVWTAIYQGVSLDSHCTRIADTPLDAVYEIVVWMLENGYLKKGNK